MQASDTKKFPRSPHLSRYTIFMVLLLILILIATLWWSVRNDQAQEPTAIVYQPSATLTPTHTPTSSLTPTPTRTPRPTWTTRPRLTDTPTQTPTPSRTPTSTRLPTITLALPFRDNDRYQLVPWSAELADRAAQLADEYPDNQYPKPQDKTKPAYQKAFTASVYAYREALLRFPDDQRAGKWQWKLAYALAQTGSPEAVQFYAGFIQGALKRGDLRAEDLPEWFHLQEPRLTLLLENIPAKPGQLNQDLIQIMEGGVFLWLLETPSDIQVKPITQVFNFGSASATAHLLGDLNGDGDPEVAVYQADADQPTRLAAPRIFSLSGSKLQELNVQPALPYDLQTGFTASLESAPQGGLIVKASLFPACPVTVLRPYSWADDAFTPSAVQIQVAPQPSLVQYCEPVLKHAFTSWSALENLTLLEAVMPLWPPALDIDNFPYPQDASDELRFKLGVFQALAGKFDPAVATFQAIKGSPVTPQSRWIARADQFLRGYQEPSDLYRACQAEPDCNLRLALNQMIRLSQISDLAQVQETLPKMGVSIRAAGIFDFDQDGQPERWITLQPRPGQSLEFWILATTPQGVRALFVDLVKRDRPAPFYNEPVAHAPPVFQVDAQKGFRFNRIPGSEEPYLEPTQVLVPVTTYTRDMLLENQTALLSGVDPALVRDSLLDVLDSGRFNCLNDRICDQFYYTLGLADELAGDSRQAIDAYLKLWWENSRSPFTRIARLKLSLPTPTPSPTRSTTVTGTPGMILGATTTPMPAPPENPYPGPGDNPNPYP